MIAYTDRCAPLPNQKLFQGEEPIEEYVKAIQVIRNHRFEKIPDDIPVKVYYDFDYNINHKDDDFAEIFQIETAKWILKRILIVLSLYWKNKTNIDPIFNVSQSHRPTPVIINGKEKPPKYSFHIIITNIAATKALQKYLLVNQINPALDTLSKINEHIFLDKSKKQNEELLDIKVYGDGKQKLRSLNAVKDDEPERPMLMMSIDELNDLPIVNDISLIDADNANLIFNDNIVDTIVSYANNLHIHTEEIPQKQINFADEKGFTDLVNQNILESKYIDYANLIDKNLIATHCGMRSNRFKFIKASQHIGISFDIVYSILRDAPNNDRDENYDCYHQVEKEGAFKVGWSTILKLAEQSDAEKKKELDVKWRRKQSSFYIDFVLFRQTDYRMALTFLELCLKYNNENIVSQISPSSEKKWFMFSPSKTGDNFKWNYCDANIRKLIPTELKGYFLNYKNPLDEKMKLYEEEQQTLRQSFTGLKKNHKDYAELESKLTALSDKITNMEIKIKAVNALITKFETVETQNKIMRQLADLVSDMGFLMELDNNPTILCCANGVIDLEKKEFRPAKPSDLCSKSTNINYSTNHSQEVLDEIDFFFNQVFRNDEQRDYMWAHLASTLYGLNANQTFSFYNGDGSNGKSMLICLMELVLGDYCKPIPVSLITQKGPSIGGCSSEIYALKGCRLAVMQEPEKGERMQVGVMKILTGTDTITANEKFLPVVSFKCFFSLVVCSNYFFNIFSNDTGTWRRIKVIEFQTLFKDIGEIDDKTGKPYIIDNESVWLKDKTLKSKLECWKEAMLYKLVQIAFKTNGMVNDCKMVVQKTLEYRNSQNRMQQFIDEKIIIDPSKKVKKSILVEELKLWFDATFGIKTVKPQELFELLIKNDFECINEYFIGIDCKRHFVDEDVGVVKSKEELFIQKFNRYYEITNNNNDYVLTTSLEEWAKDEKLKINSSKTINEVLEKNLKIPKDNRKQKKVEVFGSPEKLPRYVWIGIKRRDVVVEDEPADIENITVEMNNVSMNEKQSCPTISVASVSTPSSIIVDEYGCAGCGVERVCKCNNPNYKEHRLNHQLFCIHCNNWKCRCGTDVYEKKIDGKSYYVENEIDGFIYEVISDEECGEEIGKYENKVPVFYKKI